VANKYMTWVNAGRRADVYARELYVNLRTLDKSGAQGILVEEVPEGDFEVPIGEARLARSGKDVSIITYAATVWKALEAAEELAAEGLSAEVLDLRTLAPLDDGAIFSSVRKTHRALVVHEDTRTGGLAGEITARISES